MVTAKILFFAPDRRVKSGNLVDEFSWFLRPFAAKRILLFLAHDFNEVVRKCDEHQPDMILYVPAEHKQDFDLHMQMLQLHTATTLPQLRVQMHKDAVLRI